MKKTFILLLLWMTGWSYGQDLSGLQLVADYPFAGNADEQTGNYQPANTHNVTYGGGAVYSNGIYQGNGDPNYCWIETDDIQELTGNKFVIKLDVKIEENYKPVFVIGDLYLWLSVDIFSNNELRVLTYETGNFNGCYNSGFIAQLNTWYSLGIMYDATTRKLEFYVDNVKKIDTILQGDLDHHNETNLLNTNRAWGKAFKGYWKNLKIYGISGGSNSLAVLHHNVFNIYPNPAEQFIKVDFAYEQKANIRIRDMQGKILMQQEVNNHRYIDVSSLSKGIYQVEYIYNNRTYIQKLIK